MRLKEGIKASTRWTLKKYRALEWERDRESAKPYETLEFAGNALLHEGIAELHNLITGTGSPTVWGTSSYLGVGDDNTAVNPATDGGLQAATNKLYRIMDTASGGYPKVSAQTSQFQAIFEDGVAQFAWNEVSLSNTNSDAGVNLNRKVQSLGTKTAGQTWTLLLEITWS